MVLLGSIRIQRRCLALQMADCRKRSRQAFTSDPLRFAGRCFASTTLQPSEWRAYGKGKNIGSNTSRVRVTSNETRRGQYIEVCKPCAAGRTQGKKLVAELKPFIVGTRFQGSSRHPRACDADEAHVIQIHLGDDRPLYKVCGDGPLS